MDGNQKLTHEESKKLDEYNELKQKLLKRYPMDECYSILNNKYPQFAKFDNDFQIYQNNWANKSDKPSSKKSCMKVCRPDSTSYPTCMKECMSSELMTSEPPKLEPSKLVETDGNETDGNETDDEMQSYEEFKKFLFGRFSPYDAYLRLTDEYAHLAMSDPELAEFHSPKTTPPKPRTKTPPKPRTKTPPKTSDVLYDFSKLSVSSPKKSPPRSSKRSVDTSEGFIRRPIDRERSIKRSRKVERLLLVHVPATDTMFAARQEACEKHMPYAQRPVSCTETVFRTLGFITHETFQKFIMENRPRYHEESISWAVNSTGDNTIQYQTKDLFTFTDVISSIPPNHAIMFMGERHMATGHAMIIAKTEDNVLRFLDPSSGEIIDGVAAIQQHLRDNGYIRFGLPYSYDTNADANEKFSISDLKQWGGSKSTFSINLNNLKYKNLFAVLGNLIEKIFSKLSLQKNISVSFRPFSYKNPEQNSAILLFGETNGKGSTMILTKGREVILIDPISNRIYKGEKIKQHLNHFDNVLAINIGQTKQKTKTRKKTKKTNKTKKTKKPKSVFIL